MAKQTKLRESAKGQLCQIRIPGHCLLDNTETTVLAHVKLPGFSGVGIKPSDIHATYACAKCHDLIDGRTHSPELSGSELRILELEGMYRTQSILIEGGLIKLPASKSKSMGPDTTSEWEKRLGVKAA